MNISGRGLTAPTTIGYNTGRTTNHQPQEHTMHYFPNIAKALTNLGSPITNDELDHWVEATDQDAMDKVDAAIAQHVAPNIIAECSEHPYWLDVVEYAITGEKPATTYKLDHDAIDAAQKDFRAGPYYIECRDFVTAFVGPFATTAAAAHHIETVTKPRGDADAGTIINATDFADGRADGWMVVTPDDDKNFDPNA